MNLNTRRYNGIPALLANPQALAALHAYNTDPAIEDSGLTERELTYLESLCDCAADDIGLLLETFARLADESDDSLTPADIARAMTTLATLCGGLIPEIATIRSAIACATENARGRVTCTPKN